MVRRVILFCGLFVAFIAAYTAPMDQQSQPSKQVAYNTANLYKERFKFKIRHSRSIWQHEINTMICEQEDAGESLQASSGPQG